MLINEQLADMDEFFCLQWFVLFLLTCSNNSADVNILMHILLFN